MSIPNIAINGATTRLERRADSFMVSVHAGLPNALCVPPEWRKLSFEWSQELGPSFSLDPTIRQSKDLYISRNTLEAYHTYAFTVTSWLTVEPASRCVPASYYHPPISFIAFLSPTVGHVLSCESHDPSWCRSLMFAHTNCQPH